MIILHYTICVGMNMMLSVNQKIFEPIFSQPHVALNLQSGKKRPICQYHLTPTVTDNACNCIGIATHTRPEFLF